MAQRAVIEFSSQFTGHDMGYGANSYFSDSIASGATTSAGVDLSRSWTYVSVYISTMSTSAELSVHGTYDSGTVAYLPVYASLTNTSTVGSLPIKIASSLGTNGGIAILNNYAGIHHIKFVASAAVNGGVLFKVICGG